jgi:hypothetical protein
MRGCGRDVEGRRRSPDRASRCDREHELSAPGESELGVTVKAHLALLPAVVIADAQPGRRAGLLPQPFTTCVGGTSRQLKPDALAFSRKLCGSASQLDCKCGERSAHLMPHTKRIRPTSRSVTASHSMVMRYPLCHSSQTGSRRSPRKCRTRLYCVPLSTTQCPLVRGGA